MSFYCHTDAQNAPLFSLVCVFLLTKLKVPNHQNVLFRYFPLCDHNGAKKQATLLRQTMVRKLVTLKKPIH